MENESKAAAHHCEACSQSMEMFSGGAPEHVVDTDLETQAEKDAYIEGWKAAERHFGMAIQHWEQRLLSIHMQNMGAKKGDCEYCDVEHELRCAALDEAYLLHCLLRKACDMLASWRWRVVAAFTNIEGVTVLPDGLVETHRRNADVLKEITTKVEAREEEERRRRV